MYENGFFAQALSKYRLWTQKFQVKIVAGLTQCQGTKRNCTNEKVGIMTTDSHIQLNICTKQESNNTNMHH
jgi:hypothetical protein